MHRTRVAVLASICLLYINPRPLNPSIEAKKESSFVLHGSGESHMFAMMIASAIFAAAFQSTAADNARTTLRNCIKQATTEAKAQKVAGDAFAAFARQKCAAQETSFKSAVWAFDSKNKVSKKQSESDANLQIEDFVASAADRYAMESSPQ